MSDETRERNIERELYRAAVELIERRYPTGWGGAAAMRVDSGTVSSPEILTSVSIETFNAAASLCIETGAMCEAAKLNRRITHTLCLVRDDEHAPFKVLTPCGICQERLRYWGGDVRCAVSDSAEDGRPLFVPLIELQSHHWTQAYPASEIEHFED